jgi:hypothetical protein
MVQVHLAAKNRLILLRGYANYPFIQTIFLATSCSESTFGKDAGGDDVEPRVNNELAAGEDSVDSKARQALNIRHVKYPSENKVATKNGSRDSKTRLAVRIRHVEVLSKNKTGSAVRIQYVKYPSKDETGSAGRTRPVKYTLSKKVTTEKDSRDLKTEPAVRILYVEYTPKVATEKDSSDRKRNPYESRRGPVRIRWQPTFTKSVVRHRRLIRYHYSENRIKPPPINKFLNGRFPRLFSKSLMKWETLALKAKHKLDIGHTTPSSDTNEVSTALVPIGSSSTTGFVAIKPSSSYGEPISNVTLWQGRVHYKPNSLPQLRQGLYRLSSLPRLQNPLGSRAFSSTPVRS